MKPHYKLNIDGTCTAIANYQLIRRVRQVQQMSESDWARVFRRNFNRRATDRASKQVTA